MAGADVAGPVLQGGGRRPQQGLYPSYALAAHLGRWPAGYSERERQKEEGRRLLHGATLDEKLRGADLVLTALYDREALQRLHRERSGQPPAFTRFLRTLDLEAVLGEEMAPEVQRQYGLREKRRAKE